jgi:hypothetical protein
VHLVGYLKRNKILNVVAGRPTASSHLRRTCVSNWDSEDFGFKLRSSGCIAYVAGTSVVKNLLRDVKNARPR